ncbi:MAG TPA: T9SS type A sorting domain-containing protein [Chitinophagaceae bacterium]|nr:T9SS type A sorting domain-containing protein [Chitinophagaceae bacterium]
MNHLKKTVSTAILLFCISHFILAQTMFTKLTGYTGSFSYSCGTHTSDGGFVTTSRGIYSGTSGTFIIKTNAVGDTLWSKRIISDTLFPSEILETNNGVSIAGTAISGGLFDFFLLKTDLNGNLLWAKTYGGNSSDHVVTLIKTMDGGFLIAGGTESFGAGMLDIYIVKTDSNGTLLWTKTMGGANPEDCRSVLQTLDSGYVFGCTRYVASGVHNYLIRTNSLGDTLWTKSYYDLNGNAFDIHTVLNGSNNGYVLIGRAWGGSSHLQILKTDSLGKIVWYKTYGKFNGSIHYSIGQQTTDGCYICVSATTNYNSLRTVNLLIKFDTLGYVLGIKTISADTTRNNIPKSIQQTPDGGFYITGEALLISDLSDTYIIKTDSSGSSGCNDIIQNGIDTIAYNYIDFQLLSITVSSGGTESPMSASIVSSNLNYFTACGNVPTNNSGIMEAVSLNVSPNPFKNELLLYNTISNGEISLTDISGKELLRQKTSKGNTQIITEHLSSGLYILHYLEKDKIVNMKVMKD